MNREQWVDSPAGNGSPNSDDAPRGLWVRPPDRFSPGPVSLPAIAFTDDLAAADVVATDHTAARCLVAAIQSQPVAATVLLQLLRQIETLPPEQALIAESLAYGVLQGGAEHACWLDQQRGSLRTTDVAAAPGQVEMERTGGVLMVRMRRPAAHNAIDVALRDALREAFELAAADGTIERIVLSGEGRAFSVGADLFEFGTTRDPALAHMIRMCTLPAYPLVQCGSRLLVRIQGACIGSALEMAAFAGRIEAQRGAFFQLPELRMGLIPGAGGCVSVSRRIGRQKTALMVLSGRRFSAATALEWGLIDAIVD
jgi:hypothetical protein